MGDQLSKRVRRAIDANPGVFTRADYVQLREIAEHVLDNDPVLFTKRETLMEYLGVETWRAAQRIRSKFVAWGYLVPVDENGSVLEDHERGGRGRRARFAVSPEALKSVERTIGPVAVSGPKGHQRSTKRTTSQRP